MKPGKENKVCRPTDGYWIGSVVKCNITFTPIAPKSNCKKYEAAIGDEAAASQALNAFRRQPFVCKCYWGGGSERLLAVAEPRLKAFGSSDLLPGRSRRHRKVSRSR